MRLRLVHTLSLLLVAAVALAVAAMGGATAWNIERGFTDYLAARDLERLERFASIAARAIAEAGGASALDERRVSMRRLLDEFAEADGGARPPKPPPPEGRGPPKPPPPARDGVRFGERVAIYDLAGRPAIGRPLPRAAGYIEAPVQVGADTIATVRLIPAANAPEGVDARFLRRQYVAIAVVAAALMLVALVLAWWVARRLVHPLVAVQQAARRIARGEFAVRLPETGSGEVADVVRDLNRMAAALERLEGARRRWIAEFAHELRTPLTVLRGEIEALDDGVRPFDRRAVLSLREEVLRLAKLADDLHLLAVADLKSLPCEFAETDAAEIVRRTVDRFRARAQDAGLVLACAGLPERRLRVYWDAGRIEQLLANLIENSLRYTDAPGRIAIVVAAERDRVRITIEDTPPGIAAAQAERIFDPLYRADRARSRASGGSGLGLAICKAIVEAHRGGISAGASALGGLRIAIDLPVQPR